MTIENKDPSIEEQRELLQTIKFPPKQYKLEIVGRGGEIVIGKVKLETYEYLEENDISIDELIEDEENDLEIPEEHLFITEGNWYDCDDIAHESGATMDDLSSVVIYDELGNEVWSHSLDIPKLIDLGIKVEP